MRVLSQLVAVRLRHEDDRMRLAKYLMSVSLLFVSAVRAQTGSPWVIGPFTRPTIGNPVIAPRNATKFFDPIIRTGTHWETLHTFNPAAIVRRGKVYLLYRAEDDSGDMQIGGHTSRLGLAVSGDGIHFLRYKKPVLYPENDGQRTREWPGGVEDPRIVESENGDYVLTYTQWNRQSYSIGIATSHDLEHWKKHGPAFLEASQGRYARLNYKSASILTQLDPIKKRLIAARVNGSYWMYWGEGVIHLASSKDLLQWTPAEKSDGALVDLLRPRPNHFDSMFPEVGPPALLTAQGIVLFYNGKNAGLNGDPDLGPNAYAVGEALFDPKDPARVVGQTASPVLKPEMRFEKTGQYAAGTTFGEGLVLYKMKWFLYYGCADSLVAVAISASPIQPRAGGHYE